MPQRVFWLIIDTIRWMGFPGGKVVNIHFQCRRLRRYKFDPQVEKIPWRRKGKPTPVSLPGKPHRQRNLVGYSPWGPQRVRHNLATKQQHRGLWDSWEQLKFRVVES